MQKEATVAVIGGGISGLVCATRLLQLGVNNTTVFDTGQHAAGGRCSSRTVNINGKIHVFDHSAQYFTVSDPRFAKIVSYLHSKGAVKLWNGAIGHVKNGKFEKDKNLTQAFVGVDGMRSVANCLASNLRIKHPTWVANVLWDASMKKWNVDRHGYFDYLVIAHNGKCADKLMSNANVPSIHRLLQVRFSDCLNLKERKMHLCSLWVLMVAFPKSLNLSYEGAHVEDDDDISWIGNNSAKLSKPGHSSTDCTECWTIFSTKQFGSANKVSQENIPPRKSEEVTNKLLLAFGRVTKLSSKLPPPCFTKVQLWGAAVPLNVLQTTEECVFDGQHNVGICGDWLVSPSIQGAAMSGLALAEKISKHSLGLDSSSTSLTPVFSPANSSTIGEFPTNSSLIFNPKT